MKRRIFVKSGLLASLIGTSGISLAGNHRKKAERDYYELRTYKLKDQSQKQMTSDYLENALIPALNRMNITPVGVFEPMEPGEQMELYVLITYPQIEVFTDLVESLKKDTTYLSVGADYLKAVKDNPAYERIESNFLGAFSGIPNIEVPQQKERMFELRRYESHSEYAGNQKVKMFNEGELEVFRKTGLHPVFFGQALIGTHIPNLTYMVYFKDMEEHDENWTKFREHPDWIGMKDLPEYKDTVSQITKTFLKPLPFSQV
ncbi:MAG: NIPSNAP family protein [Candidatus Cyclobacteriaceae bacterium M3_2C_046]